MKTDQFIENIEKLKGLDTFSLRVRIESNNFPFIKHHYTDDRVVIELLNNLDINIKRGENGITAHFYGDCYSSKCIKDAVFKFTVARYCMI